MAAKFFLVALCVMWLMSYRPYKKSANKNAHFPQRHTTVRKYDYVIYY